MKLSDLTTDDVLEAQFEDVRTLARIYAEAKADRLRLDEFKKIKKAQLMRLAELEGTSAIGAQERDARASPEYEEIINGLAAATETEARALWELKLAEWRFEAWRSKEATRRAEKNRYGA